MRSDNGMAAFAHFRTKTALEIAQGQEIEMENTVSAPYDSIKLFGKSERKAEWRQAEGKTGQSVTEQSLNLFSAPSMLANKYYKYETGEITGITGLSCSSELIAVEPNTLYTLWRSKEAVTGSKSLAVRFFTRNKTYIPDHIINSSGHNIFYFTTTENTYYIGVNNDDPDITVKYGLYKGVYTAQTIPDYTPFTVESPSPAYPSELTSNIPAGSYQIPAENGTYEVTLTEDLRGLDDTYRDRICFDSVSGTGYRLNHVGKKEFDETTSFDAWQRVKNFGFRTPLENCSTGTPFSDYSLCTHFKNNYTLAYGGNGGYFGTGDTYFNGCMDSGEVNSLAQLSAFLKQEKEKGTPVTVYYVLKTPVKEALTFTKVESSSLPVLPWTAYGRNLFDKSAAMIGKCLAISTGGLYGDANGGTSDFIPVQVGETYSISRTKNNWGCFYDNQKQFISPYFAGGSVIIPEGAAYIRFSFGLFEINVTQLEKGTEPTAYEPFNPTPPEALEVSPDYPRRIYDLSDVTVTSRGRNLFDVNDWYAFLRGYTTTYVSKAVLDGYACIKYQPSITYNKPYMKGCFKENTQYTICFKARQDSVNTGTSSGFIFWYTDGASTRAYVENSTEWKQYKAISTAGKTIDRIEMAYNYGYPIYIIENSVQLLEGAYTAETLPPFDRYRCTEAKVPIPLRSLPVSDDSPDYDYIGKDGKKYAADYIEVKDGEVWHVQKINRLEPQAKYYTLSNAWVYTSGEKPLYRNGNLGLKADTEQFCSHFPYAGTQQPNTIRTEGSMSSILLAGEADLEQSMMNQDFQEWLDAERENGSPVTVDYILETPLLDNVTLQDWGQALLGLKTAPYSTELFADKETGGMEAVYRQFKETSSIWNQLMTSGRERVFTRDKRRVIVS